MKRAIWDGSKICAMDDEEAEVAIREGWGQDMQKTSSDKLRNPQQVQERVDRKRRRALRLVKESENTEEDKQEHLEEYKTRMMRADVAS